VPIYSLVTESFAGLRLVRCGLALNEPAYESEFLTGGRIEDGVLTVEERDL